MYLLHREKKNKERGILGGGSFGSNVFLNTGQMRAQPILHNMKICWGKGEVGD
jgi:hypothetical protein